MSQISRAIERLTAADAADVKETIQQLDSYHIKTQGITSTDIVKLIGVVTNPLSKVSSTHKTRIIRDYLYFKVSVPTESVIAVLGSVRVKSPTINDKVLSQNVQIQLIEWLASVYSFLEEHDIIERLYGMVFNYLEFEYIRPKIAHLLFLATKKKHVTEMRVNRLLNIYHKYGFGDHITALILLYQRFAPDQIFDTFPRISQKVFAHPNMEYLQELINLREESTEDIELQSTYDEIMYVEEFENKLKRRKQANVELDYTLLVPESEQGGIPSLEKLSQNLENVDTEFEWSYILASDRGYRLLSYVLKESEHQHFKLNSWIALMIESFNDMEDSDIEKFLNSIRNYTELSSKVPKAIISSFLLNKDLVKTDRYQNYVFFFMQNLGTMNSGDLEKIFKKFQEISPDMSVNWYSSYIDSVSHLIKYWSLEISDGITIVVPTLLELFEATIKDLPDKLKKFQYDRLLVISVLRLIKSIHSLPIKCIQIRHVVLPQSLIYPLLFISDPIAFSEICAHLNWAKNILRAAESTDEVTRLTNLHNAYVVDICNIIWRNKAFEGSKSSTNASFGMSYDFIDSLQNSISIFDQNSTFKTLFNIHSSPAFAGYSASILHKIEDGAEVSVRHEGPLTQQSVQNIKNDSSAKWLDAGYEDVRVQILKELESMGYNGVSELLFSHLKSLLNK